MKLQFKSNNNNNIKIKLRLFGEFLSNMIMPIIGAFIGWGLLSAIVLNLIKIYPNSSILINLKILLSIMFNVLIVSFIGFFAGKQIYGIKGAIISAFSSLGIIISSGTTYYINIYNSMLDWTPTLNIEHLQITGNILNDWQPMILGVMIFCPLITYIYKLIDKKLTETIKIEYQSVVINFVIAIYICINIFIFFYGFSVVIAFITALITISFSFLQNNHLSILLPIIAEPSKILFLNNVINLGVFIPLGIQEVQEVGKSFLFYVETSPGIGVGVLLAYYMSSQNKLIKYQALSSILIVLFGGTQELYFPFLLLNISFIWIPVLGGILSVFIYQLFDAGAFAPIAPGSIILEYIFTEPTWKSYLGFTIAFLEQIFFVWIIGYLYLILQANKNGERVFVNPYMNYINQKYNKSLVNKKIDLYETKKYKPLKIEYKIKNKKRIFLVEKIEYENNDLSICLINNKNRLLKKVEYQMINNKLYQLKIFDTAKDVRKYDYFMFGILLNKNQILKKSKMNLNDPKIVNVYHYEEDKTYYLKTIFLQNKKTHRVKLKKEIIDGSLINIKDNSNSI